MSKVLVIGGGPAGLFLAAIAAAEQGHQVVLLERNEKIGKKLFITGKGRCNLTNACDTEELFSNIPRNSKFLYSAVYSYDNFRVMDFFEQNGTPVKVERGNRVFPVSDHSSDVIAALKRSLDAHKVKDYVSYSGRKAYGIGELCTWSNYCRGKENAGRCSSYCNRRLFLWHLPVLPGMVIVSQKPADIP